MQQCKRCGSLAINHHLHGRDGSELCLSDVCYWRKRFETSAGDKGELEVTQQGIDPDEAGKRRSPNDLPDTQKAAILRGIRLGDSFRDLAREYNISIATVAEVDMNYGHLEGL